MLKTNMRIGYLITPYEAWNKPENAEEWRSRLPKTKSVIE
jgi:hypothetical protein